MLDAVALHMDPLSIMNVGIPFEITAEGMKDTDNSGSKIFGFIIPKKHI